MTHENPTIPQIIRALTTLEDRHGQKLVDVCEAYEKRIAEAKTVAPLPPLQNDEYLHFEYVEWTSVEDGGYYSNMMQTTASREKGMELLRKLIGDENVFALHVRRYPMPDKGVHAYDEIQRLPVAQSQAYMEGLRADKLDEAYSEVVVAKAELETGYDQLVTSMEDTEKALRSVIDKLMDQMRRTSTQLGRDNKNCTYSEPGALHDLLFGSGVIPDEQWERRMLSKAREDVRRARKHREAVERAMETGNWPVAPFEHGGATERRRCACGKTWHMDEVPPWHNGLQCQAPTHEERVAHAKKTSVWPVAKMKSASGPPIRVCACGQEWAASAVPSRHNGLECRPEKCETSFNGGMCAGDKEHEGQCSPNPADFQRVV
jgi:hypothetical protein